MQRLGLDFASVAPDIWEPAGPPEPDTLRGPGKLRGLNSGVSKALKAPLIAKKNKQTNKEKGKMNKQL